MKSLRDYEMFEKKRPLVNVELSPKEADIARLLCWGYIQKEIASELNLSPLTIATHLRNIYFKLGIHKETDLARWYWERYYSIYRIK